MSDVYAVWDEYWKELQDELWDLALQARKTGLSEIKAETIEEEDTIDTDRDTGQVTQHRKYSLSLKGHALKENGWEFCISIDHVPSGDIVFRLPGATAIDIEPYLLSSNPYCDHCRSEHGRIATFVLRNKNGLEVRVGWTCIQAFLRYGNYDRLLSRLRYVRRVLYIVANATMMGPGRGKTL